LTKAAKSLVEMVRMLSVHFRSIGRQTPTLHFMTASLLLGQYVRSYKGLVVLQAVESTATPSSPCDLLKFLLYFSNSQEILVTNQRKAEIDQRQLFFPIDDN
jgi:hypothetical protein